MKSRYLVCVSAGAVLSLFVYGANLGQAATAIPLAGDGFSQAPDFQQVRWEEEKAEKLRQAYWILAQGDHDYKGHRVIAMHHLEAAAKLLDVDLHGGEHRDIHEKQVLSDVKLHEARHALQTIVDETHGKEHDHIRKAIDEIDTSLAIR